MSARLPLGCLSLSSSMYMVSNRIKVYSHAIACREGQVSTCEYYRVNALPLLVTYGRPATGATWLHSYLIHTYSTTQYLSQVYRETFTFIQTRFDLTYSAASLVMNFRLHFCTASIPLHPETRQHTYIHKPIDAHHHLHIRLYIYYRVSDL